MSSLSLVAIHGALHGELAEPRNSTKEASTASVPALPNSQVCSPLMGRVPAPFPVSANQPASTRRMIERVQQVMASTDSRSHFYLSGESALELKTLMQAGSRLQALDIKPLYAEFLLRAGDSEGALKEFNEWEDMMHESRISLRESDTHRLMISKAICYLRIGEQENCLLNHTTDSCIFPIAGAGIHKLPRGSQGAIDGLMEILYRAPNNMAARWLLNIAYMTLGKYPDQVPSRWLIPPSAFASDYDIGHFPDVAGKLGLDIDDLAGGVVLEDFDGDGFLDLMVSSCSLLGQLRVFRNNGDGSFTERTVEAGLAGVVGGLNLIHADYNNDGHPDVLVLRGGWEKAGGKIPNSLLKNNGNFTFTDVTEEAGLLSFHPTQTAVWFDFNGDGWLDLFIGNENTDQGYDPCELYRNNGDGTFTECAAECGVQVIGFVKGVASGDYDNDGRPDLYLSRREGANLLFHNDGPAPESGPARAKWKFTEVSAAAKVADTVYGFPCWFFDYDNDGWLDLMVTGYRIHDLGDVAADYLGKPTDGARAHLYHNNHDGTFTDVSQAMGVSKVLHAMGVNFGDLDNDGWLDFYLGTGDPQFDTLIPNRMFRNDGGQRFQDVTTSGGFGVLQKGHAIAFGDINNDGAQDIYEVVGGAYSGDNYRNMLFANPGNQNGWLKLSLEGVQSNRSAIGARITVVVTSPGETGERKITSTVGSGASFGSASFRRELGLGKANQIVRVEVFWPATGKSQTFTQLKINHFYRLREGDSTAVNLPLKSFPLPTSPTAPDHHHGW